ncbi:SHOCT domain-containing protein [Halomarina ordinaria]|uniref:SHOCT domain-containing protein n=1 Tax=Halomarina ordinaria TaxID=3033939 RepID=A0ABD5U3I2_9EURY|nr:SHOCT domain-containing protein [Halomarina sp. PSRA2]
MATTTELAGIVALAFVALGALLVLPMVMMGTGTMSAGGPMMGGGYGTAPGWLSAVAVGAQLLVLSLLVALAVLAYRATVARPRVDPAVEELRRAYARGDLSDEEYDRRRERLTREERG